MGEYVRLLGFLGYEGYQQQMGEADLFLHPSVTAADGDSEGGAPTAIPEAQVMGLPVTSTLHVDIPHVVAPDESALLSGERDVAGLAVNVARHILDAMQTKYPRHLGRLRPSGHPAYQSPYHR